MVSSTLFVLLASTLPATTLAYYKLVQDYTGPNFFENFDFFDGSDPTNGHVDFVGDATADITGLAGLAYYTNASDPSEVVYLGVENQTVLPVEKGRQSLRMQSVQAFNRSLVIADILHQPSNVCGVWPAFWMLGTSATWPAAGEIDILEGVNDINFNRMSMHTTTGLVVNRNDGAMTGSMKTTNCDVAAPNQDQNVGCTVDDDPSVNSYGNAFNQMQGGVFAMEYTSEAVKIWFFNRTGIPDDIYAGTPSPPQKNGSDFHAWGLPNALFQVPADNSTQSVLQDHLRDLQIIFDTTFCGDWAGKVWNTTSCGKLAPTCEEYVSKNPSAFTDAYWLIKSLQVFEVDDNGDAGVDTTNDHDHDHDNTTTVVSSKPKPKRDLDYSYKQTGDQSSRVKFHYARRDDNDGGSLLSLNRENPSSSVDHGRTQERTGTASESSDSSSLMMSSSYLINSKREPSLAARRDAATTTLIATENGIVFQTGSPPPPPKKGFITTTTDAGGKKGKGKHTKSQTRPTGVPGYTFIY